MWRTEYGYDIPSDKCSGQLVRHEKIVFGPTLWWLKGPSAKYVCTYVRNPSLSASPCFHIAGSLVHADLRLSICTTLPNCCAWSPISPALTWDEAVTCKAIDRLRQRLVREIRIPNTRVHRRLETAWIYTYLFVIRLGPKSLCVGEE
jgi:hypothetical protein